MSEPLVTTSSDADVATLVQRVTAVLERRGITLFAVIDHAAGARGVGLPLADETVLLFGNPAAGTPLMQQDARVGIELPLKLLVWDDAGTTRIGWADPVALAERFELGGAAKVLHAMHELLAGIVAEVV